MTLIGDSGVTVKVKEHQAKHSEVNALHCIECFLTVLCLLLHVDSLGLFVTKQRLQVCRANDFNLWL